MSTGKIICIIICLVGAVIIFINTILKIINALNLSLNVVEKGSHK